MSEVIPPCCFFAVFFWSVTFSDVLVCQKKTATLISQCSQQAPSTVLWCKQPTILVRYNIKFSQPQGAVLIYSLMFLWHRQRWCLSWIFSHIYCSLQQQYSVLSSAGTKKKTFFGASLFSRHELGTVMWKNEYIQTIFLLLLLLTYLHKQTLFGIVPADKGDILKQQHKDN